MATTVRTKEELEKAKENNVSEIIVLGELAENLHTAKKITTLGKIALGVLAVGLAAIPVTGGVSTLLVAPVATSVGLSTPAIFGIIAVGAGLLLAIFNLYDEIEFSAKGGDSEAKMILRRK